VNLRDLVQVLPDIIEIKGNTSVDINCIAYDSRKVSSGCIFVAIKGYSKDGHDYINQAVSKGAKAVIGENKIELKNTPYIRVANSRKALAYSSNWFYEYPSRKLKIVGITGTNGKTTTAYLVKSLLEGAGFSTGIIGTIGNIIKDQHIPAVRTTPESLELNQLFVKMIEHQVDYAVMEVSSHSLKLHRVDGIGYEVGVFTNLTQDHLDFHGSFEDYFAAKKRLFEASKKAVVNVDDTYGRKLRELLTIPTITYGINNDSDIKARNIDMNADGVSYDIIVDGELFHILYKVPGEFSINNSLAALAVGFSLGLPMKLLAESLKNVKGVSGRFEPIKMGQNFSVIIDYAHTPDGIENVLKAIKSFCKGRIITVFGCGGDRDKKKRPIMGGIASRLSDYCIITSDNPRSEEPDIIMKEIEQGISEKNNYEKITDRREAIKRALEIAKKDDVILIAGKGHETYQIIKDQVIKFDDGEVVKQLLKDRGF
jgi:UDP-N-acetylmuramoyl-L-alanyl-D-glutamate--2,6-diaminopimelate ligase